MPDTDQDLQALLNTPNTLTPREEGKVREALIISELVASRGGHDLKPWGVVAVPTSLKKAAWGSQCDSCNASRLITIDMDGTLKMDEIAYNLTCPKVLRER